MRKLVLFLLVAAAGYFAYTHQPIARALYFLCAHQDGTTAAALLKGPYAMKELSRGDSSTPFNAIVSVVNGNRWRVEVRKLGSPRILVQLCDGSRVFSNLPRKPGTSLDPRPSTIEILSVTAKLAAVASKYPNITEQCDGHTCWKTTATIAGMTAQIWIDSSTRFPVCFLGTANWKYTEDHITRLPIDFTQPETEVYFDPAHTEPIFASYLVP